MGLALRQARDTLADRDPGLATGEPGFYLQFDIPVADRDAVDALESKRSAIELVAVRPPSVGDEIVSATVFVPERSAEFYARKIEEYRDEDTRWGKPKHEALIARIETVRLGLVQALFTDARNTYPPRDREVWWEVWLRDGRLDEFRPIASELSLPLKEHTLNFPERDVVLLLADEAAVSAGAIIPH